MKSYRNQIIEIINKVIETREIIFEQIVNLAMSNEYEPLQDTFSEGDIYSFSMSHFENMEDLNIQKLVKLCKKTEETIFSIMNINGIEDEEVNLQEKEK